MIDTILSDVIAVISPLTTLQIVRENELTKPQCIRATLVPLSPTRLTAGINKVFQHTGIIQLDIMQPVLKGTNTTLINTLVEALSNMVPINYEVSKVYRVQSSHAPIAQTSASHISSIRIEYKYFNTF